MSDELEPPISVPPLEAAPPESYPAAARFMPGDSLLLQAWLERARFDAQTAAETVQPMQNAGMGVAIAGLASGATVTFSSLVTEGAGSVLRPVLAGFAVMLAGVMVFAIGHYVTRVERGKQVAARVRVLQYQQRLRELEASAGE